MDDVISRQEAISLIKEYERDSTCPLDYVSIIRKVPSVQPRKGKWEMDNPHSEIYRYACSECHAHHRARYDFCPSCGADMREGDAE